MGDRDDGGVMAIITTIVTMQTCRKQLVTMQKTTVSLSPTNITSSVLGMHISRGLVCDTTHTAVVVTAKVWVGRASGNMGGATSSLSSTKTGSWGNGGGGGGGGGGGREIYIQALWQIVSGRSVRGAMTGWE